MYNPSPLAFVYPPSEECLRLSFHILFANHSVPPTIDAACLALDSLTDAIEVGLLSKLDTADLLITCHSPLASMLGEDDIKLVKHVLQYLEIALDHAFDQSPSLLAMYFVPLINLCGNLNASIADAAVDTVLNIYLNNANSAGACLRMLDGYLVCNDLRVRLGTARVFDQALSRGVWSVKDNDRFLNLINVTITGIYEAQLEDGDSEVHVRLNALYFSAWCKLYKSCKRFKKFLSKVIFSLDKEKQLAVAIAELCVPNDGEDDHEKRNLAQRGHRLNRPAVPSHEYLLRNMSLRRMCIDPYAKKLVKVTEGEIYIPVQVDSSEFESNHHNNNKRSNINNPNTYYQTDNIREKMKAEMQQICLELKMNRNEVDETRVHALETMLLKCLRTLVLEQKKPPPCEVLSVSIKSQRSMSMKHL